MAKKLIIVLHVFINEIPAKLIEEVRPPPKFHVQSVRFKSETEYSIKSAANETGFALGQHVKHAKFGEGVVLNYEGQSIHARVQVKFKNAGVKWLVLSYANLETA